MKIVPLLNLTCPLDGKALERLEASWRCPEGHSFDVARAGYTHLLPVQNKRSMDPGDSKEMVAARRRFLNAGFYEPVAVAVSNAFFNGISSPSGTVSCLDAGCGEGYYLRRIQIDHAESELELALLGIDISKHAVLAAAKQDRQPNWIVASNVNLPVPDSALDRLLCIFGFPVYSEFARVLKPDGCLLQIDAGHDHLRELREIIYPTLNRKSKQPVEVPEGFACLSAEALSYSIELRNAEQISDLLTMTPHLFRATADGKAKAAALTSLSVTVDVSIRRLTPLK